MNNFDSGMYNPMYDEVTTAPSNQTSPANVMNVPQRKGTRLEQSEHVNHYVMNADMYSNQAGCLSARIETPGFACDTTHMMNDKIDTETVLWRKEQSIGINRNENIATDSLLNQEVNKDINMRDTFDQNTRVFKSIDSISMFENTRLLHDLPESHESPQHVVNDLIQGFGQDTRQMIKYEK